MLVKHVVKYYRQDYGPDDVFDCETSWSDDFPHRIAEECADNYHFNHDGWECSWPIKFVVLAEDGTALGTFEVDRESVPQFYATPAK